MISPCKDQEPVWPRTLVQKSEEKSVKYRNAGNSMFSRKKIKVGS